MIKGDSIYHITSQDFLAKDFCNKRGWEAEAIPYENNGKFKVGLLLNGEIKIIRDAIWDYKDGQKAVYQAYRTLAYKIEQKENG